MKKIIYICALAPLLGACASAQVDNCNGWAKTATVDYGDGGISVTPKKTVKKQKPFVIKLSPDSDDWKDKKVIVKANTKDPSICPNESWLNGDDSYNKRNKFKYCAPLVAGRHNLRVQVFRRGSGTRTVIPCFSSTRAYTLRSSQQIAPEAFLVRRDVFYNVR